jgi:hypothetical protein
MALATGLILLAASLMALAFAGTWVKGQAGAP